MTKYNGTEWEMVRHSDKPIYPDTLESALESGFEECWRICLQMFYTIDRAVGEGARSFLQQNLFPESPHAHPVVKGIEHRGRVCIYLTHPGLSRYIFVTSCKLVEQIIPVPN